MKAPSKPGDLIKRYSTALVEGLVGKISASSPLRHRLTKGELRELFVTNLLSPFLTKQFDIGSGIVINQKEEQSDQTDMIIYDNRILPPFIKEQHIGVYPAESVVGVIEVKTNLSKNALLSAEASASRLHKEIYNPRSSIYGDYEYIRPLCAAIGFYGRGSGLLMDNEIGRQWLKANCRHIFSICLVGKFSWINLDKKGWSLSENRQNYEETKRFIAVFLDNLRTVSELRLNYLTQFAHKDWLSVYIREQEGIRKIFNKKDDENDEPSPSLAAHEDPLHDQ